MSNPMSPWARWLFIDIHMFKYIINIYNVIIIDNMGLNLSVL